MATRSVALVPEDLEGVLSELGMTLGRSTEKEVWATCPLHEQRTGSADRKPTNFSVNRATGQSFCFGCGYTAGLTNMVATVLGVSAWDASQWLRERGASLLDVVQRIERKVANQTMKIGQFKEGDKFAADPDVEFSTFADPPDDHLYLRSLLRESADYYRIRWDDGWIVPISDPDGRVRGWQFKNQREFLNYPKRIKKSNYLFGADVFTGRKAVLVESPLDVVRLHSAGYHGGLSSFGVRVSDVQMNLILGMTDHLVLALDNDEEGRNMTERIIEKYRGRLRLHVFNYGGSKAKDPGDMTDEEIARSMDEALPTTTWRNT